MGHQQYRYLHENRIFSLGVEGEAKLHTEVGSALSPLNFNYYISDLHFVALQG